VAILKRFLTSSLGELVVFGAIVVALLWAVQTWIVKPYRIPSASMAPTLQVGERILVDRISLRWQAPQIGEIMVFHPPRDTDRCVDPHQGANAAGRADARACDVVGRAESAQSFVKRVVGLPGDRLQIIGGHVIRNGRREADPYSVPCSGATQCDFPGPIVVPRGDYYMMGDNRPASEDSRFWGPVPRSWLIGDVFFSYWPPSRFGSA
jgi:signal peptidase I